MQYKLMIGIAFIMAVLSAVMTSFGMMDLFAAAGTFILSLFIIIDLGRFLLFNFVVNEWHNLRKVKYFIVLIITLLFGYSAVGVYSKLDSLVTKETKQAMVNTVVYNKANANAKVKQNRSEDLAKIAEEEYRSALDWNRNDLTNCIARARGDKNAENRCNNTKRALDNKASAALKEALAKADESLDIVEAKTKIDVENRNEIANVLMTICKLTQKSCDSYENLQNSLTIVIILVIIGTDYLQIAIILAVNTRKNKKVKKEDEIEIESEKIEIKKEQKHELPIINKPKPKIEPKLAKPIVKNVHEQKTTQDNDFVEQTTEEKLVDAIKEDPNFGKKELADGILTGEEVVKLFNKAAKRKSTKPSIFKRPFKFSGPKPQ